MKLALDSTAEDCIKYDCLQFRTPLTQYKTRKDVKYILDNGCFTEFKMEVWCPMAIKGFKDNNCIFVVAPDEVGNHEATLELFNMWETWRKDKKLQAKKWGFVLQDGVTVDRVPWKKIRAVFVGGTTKFKYSLECYKILEKARELKKWVHVGRVNTPSRIVKFFDIANSVDGTGLSKYDYMRIEALKVIADLENTKQSKLSDFS